MSICKTKYYRPNKEKRWKIDILLALKQLK
jgi:hypothetical protein